MSIPEAHPDQSKPWWRFPIVWMVIGGPIIVVIAALVTAGIAVRNVDPVLDTSESNVQPHTLPAMKARNQASELGAQAK